MRFYTCPECGEDFESSESAEEWEVRDDGDADLVRCCPACGYEVDRFEPGPPDWD